MLVRISNRDDSDQTASSEAVCSGSALFVWAVWWVTVVFKILEHLSFTEEGYVYCSNINPCPSEP